MNDAAVSGPSSSSSSNTFAFNCVCVECHHEFDDNERLTEHYRENVICQNVYDIIRESIKLERRGFDQNGENFMDKYPNLSSSPIATFTSSAELSYNTQWMASGVPLTPLPPPPPQINADLDVNLCDTQMSNDGMENGDDDSTDGENNFINLIKLNQEKKVQAINEENTLEPIVNGRSLKLYECTLCASQLSDKNYLIKHMKRMHRNVTKITCQLCATDKLIYVDEFVAHIMAVHQWALKPYRCPLCGANFYSINNYNTHLRMQHKHVRNPLEPIVNDDLITLYACTVCGTRFSDKTLLIKHTRNHHPTVLEITCKFCFKPINVDDYCDHLSEPDHYMARPFKCPVCYRLSANRRDCRDHIKRHMVNSKPVAKPSLEPIVNDEAFAIYECPTCNCKLCDKYNFIRHMKDFHIDVTKILCKLCCKYIKITEFSKHLTDQFHMASRPFECPVCLKLYCRKVDCSIHIRTIHGKRNIKSSSTAATTVSTAPTATTATTATSATNFQCGFCCMDFADQITLNEHKQNCGYEVL